MRITASDRIAGQPALIIRKLFRNGYGTFWGSGLVENILGVSSRAATRIIRELEEQGYIAAADSNTKGLYEHTVKGNALAMASAAKPVKRRKAEQTLAEFMERVREVNENDSYLYKVQTVVLFGSYLTTSEFVNDIDIAIELIPKTEDQQEFKQKCRDLKRRSQQAGRNSIT